MIAMSIVVFVLVDLSPIDPIQMNVGQTAYLSMSEAKRAQLAEYWGVNTSLWERYFHWASDALRGDLGLSLRFNAPVTEVIAARFVNSLALMATAWVLSGVFGVALGVLAAVFRNRWPDRVIKAYCLVLASTPNFWLALLFLVVFAVWLQVLPFGFSVPIGVASADVTLADLLRHLILPALTLSLLGIANIALHTREKTIDVLQSDYIRFARLRGESTTAIVWRHGLRNLSIPALTLQFASIGEIFGGSVLIEQVFSYPGLGQAVVTAGLGGDVALLVGISLVSAALVFGGNLTANLLYRLIDPRLRVRPKRRTSLSLEEAGPSLREARQPDSPPPLLEARQPGSPPSLLEARQPGSPPSLREAQRRGNPENQSGVAPDHPTESGSTKLDEHLQSTNVPLLHSPRKTLLDNRRRLLAMCIFTVVILATVIVVGHLHATGSPSPATTTDFSAKNLIPSLSHLFGTDWMGRDMLSRTLAGLALSILVGLLAACASATIALVLGVTAALGGRRADAVISWLTDLILGIPHIVLLILISYAIGRGFWGVTVGIALTHWPGLCRVIRAEVLQCRKSVYVAQASKLGSNGLRIAYRHVLPHVLPQFLVGLVLMFPHAILHEAAMTFLGFGLPPEQAAIGIILSESMGYLSVGYWWLAVFPGVALILVVLMFSGTASNLRRLVDPQSAQR